MEVLLLKDVPSLGFAGQVKKVSEGYARNFLFPQKIAIFATKQDIENFKKAVKRSEVDTSIAGSRVAALASQIKNIHLVLKKKAHDEDKLYGSVSTEEVANLLKEKGIQINKKQIEFNKTVRTTGEHKVFIKLTSKVKPELILKVVGSKE
ncbi:50S ribosomal protein L9 [Candidatus Babeliales bacterium]|nr:50S ribosomal protein L9 [Candidatus Babeliales bacterium]